MDQVLIGRSSAIVGLRERLPKLARAQRTTLIQGPTGSGKDLIARTLHAYSTRSNKPFVIVNCAALPDALVETELFGHSRGAFTGATQTRSGLIRTAFEGTLFLDEIDSLNPATQAKLLRFLETGEFRAIGADRTELSQAWVLVASNQDLERRVREGRFRADLLYRLKVMELKIPPLCERVPDIPCLAEYFLRGICGGAKSLDDSARQALCAYHWPGNVRQLKHTVEAAALLTDGPHITATALETLRPASPVPSDPSDPSLERQLWSLIEGQGFTLQQALDLCEQKLIRAALRAAEDNRTRAADRLGIHVRTIFKKLLLVPPAP